MFQGVITQAISAFMTTNGNGFSAGSGYSIGSGKAMSTILSSSGNLLFISVLSSAFNLSEGSGFSAGSKIQLVLKAL